MRNCGIVVNGTPCQLDRTHTGLCQNEKPSRLERFYDVRRGSKRLSVWIDAEYVPSVGQWGINALVAVDGPNVVELTPAEASSVLMRLP